MVKTRSTTRREQEQEQEQNIVQSEPTVPTTLKPSHLNKTITLEMPGSAIKSEPTRAPAAEPCPSRPPSGRASVASTRSKETMRRRIQLEADARKAEIKMALIDRDTELRLAELSEDEYSSHEDMCSQKDGIHEWVEKQIMFKETPAQPAPDYGLPTGELQQPGPSARQPVPASQPSCAHAAVPALKRPAPAATQMPLAPPDQSTNNSLTNTVEVLASAIKHLTTANSTSNGLLSRIGMPRELPEFSGDPLEWLQFKQAYDESTDLCRFTDRENLWRLRKCLRGAAKDSVNALFISATSPTKVISTLELRFGNPECIISKIIQDLKKLQPVHQDYQKDIVTFAVKVQNFVEAVKAVGRQEYLYGVNIVDIILTKLPTVLVSRWSDYSFKSITEGKESRLVILSDFLTEEATKVSTTASIFTSARSDQPRSKPFQSQTLVVHETDDRKCQFCRASIHKLTECKPFKKALRKVRWQHVKRSGLCYKCILSHHDRDTCPAPVCDKDDCGEPHHRLLHYPVQNRRQSAAASSATNAPQRSHSSTENVTHINVSDSRVLLKVVPVKIQGPNGVVTSTALLDDGSTVSLISAALAERAGLRGRRESMRVCGAFNDKELVCDTTVVSISLCGLDNKVHNIRARSINELSLPMQQLSFVNCDDYNYLLDIKDQLCNSDSKPEMLIGQDNYHLLQPLHVKLGKKYEPSATLTPLGWCIHGNLRVPQRARCAQHDSPTGTTLLLAHRQASPPSDDEGLLRDLLEEVRHSFSIDALGVSGKPRQNADDVRAAAQLERTSALVDGRWHVGLPWKDESSKLPDVYPTALNRLKGIVKKIKRDSGFAERYEERLQHLLTNNYATELKVNITTPKTWYLPHFGVDNPNKKKLRLVFDAAARVNGLCLNDYLFTGPDLLSSLFGIMLRFREHKIAVTGDIKDMFLRIKVRQEDQHALRFLWSDNSTGNDVTDDVKTYVMTSLIFGANCSPFVAQFIKNKNAQRFATTLPAAVDAICNSHYMDDYIDSLPDEATAIKMVKNISDIHKAGGFDICNWTSNSVEVLDSVPSEALGPAAVRFKIGQQYAGERTLGLIWYPAEDHLGFDLSLKRIPESIIQGKERPTKRLMLRVIMSIFDVLGFLAPFTIQGRIMLQDTWHLNIGWDDFIPDDIFDKWCKWLDLLKTIDRVRIPRYYQLTARGSEREDDSSMPLVAEPVCADKNDEAAPPPALSSPLDTSAPTRCATSGYDGVAASTSATKLGTDGSLASCCNNHYNNLQMHIFSDASTKAMCAVAYWRWHNNGTTFVSFIASKCRVMPVKPLTIPRAELQAALLAARLADTIMKEHKLVPLARYFWCDSTTVLHWIRNNTRKYKTFEANRLGEIDELTRMQEWRFIPTKQNVADLATRETFHLNWFEGEWFTGPTFLHKEEASWPQDAVLTDCPDLCIAVIQAVPDATLPVPDPLRFSSWLRLLRSTATVLKFIDRCKRLTFDMSCGTMERAECLLLRRAQSESFREDIAAIQDGKTLSKDSKLRTLTPFLDDSGVLRVSGRINAASEVSLEMKQPIILDGRHPVAKLIARHYHVKAAHGSQEMVVNELKQRYWILRIRPTVKGVASRCMFCRIQKSKPQVPRMGDLPQARMAHHLRPFTHCGLDLFGPMEVAVGRRREKRYGVLFTCMTVRAIHIELVASLTTDALIMALRRMAARRGWPRHLYSDNGTNLRGASTELEKAVLDLDTEVLKCEGMNNGTVWSFIPPASPHWGGAWERLIRSVKTALKVVLNERAPRDEVLTTLIAEVEGIVNSRPLMHVSVEPGSMESLTPNHFLLGSSSNLPTIGVFNESDLCLRKQWRKAQALADMFWRRWVKEILPDLIPRKKWLKEQRPLQKGDLVLVVDPDSPRNMWPKGLITQVFPGKDGRVRLVEVKTNSGTRRRSAARVAPIPLDDECCASTGVGC